MRPSKTEAALTIAATATCIAGMAGLGRTLIALFAPVALPMPVYGLLAAPIAVLAFAAVASRLGEPGARTVRWFVTRGPLLAWPVFLPLTALLLGPQRDATTDGWLLPGAPLFLGLLVHAWREPRAVAPPPAASLRRIAPEDRVLLAFTVAMAVLYVVIGWRTKFIGDNDGAYYYGLSRHIATTFRFEEPIVWHFLHVPDHLIHAPFDYWAPMTVAVLTPPMVVFGASTRTAYVTMGCVSALTLFAFWYVVCVALPLRRFAARAIAVVLFALSPTVDFWRFQPESPVLIHLFILLALIMFCQRRWVATTLCGAALFLTRTDALMLFGLVGLAALFESARESRRAFFKVALTGVVFVAGYVMWSFLAFGTPTPPAPSKLPFLGNYWQVYTFGMEHPRSLGLLLGKLDWGYFAGRMGLALGALRGTTYLNAQDGWMLLAIVPGVPLIRGRKSPETLIWLLMFVGFAMHVWLSGESFSSWRAPQGYLPLVILVGAIGLDELCDRAALWSQVGRGRLLRVAGAVALSFGLAFAFAVRARVAVYDIYGGRGYQQTFMEECDKIVGGAVVASNTPWQVLAFTHSPVVSVPYNGEAAIEQVFRKYDAKYVVLWGNPIDDVQEPSRSVFTKAITQDRTPVGGLVLERMAAPNGGHLLRIVTAPP